MKEFLNISSIREFGKLTLTQYIFLIESLNYEQELREEVRKRAEMQAKAKRGMK